MSPLGTAWHLGGLHPFEQVLVLVLAFGPFLLLGIVVTVQRRRSLAAEEAAEEAAEDAPEDAAQRAGRDAGPSGPGTPGRRGSPPSAP